MGKFEFGALSRNLIYRTAFASIHSCNASLIDE